MDEQVLDNGSGEDVNSSEPVTVDDATSMDEQQIVDQLYEINQQLGELNMNSVSSKITNEEMLEEFKGFTSSAKSGETQEVPDYSENLEDIGQFLAYTDVLLILVIIFQVLIMGLVGGKTLTEWLRHR